MEPDLRCRQHHVAQHFKDGIVSATIAGQTTAAGTVEIATFSNAAVRPMGGNIFAPTTASGEAESGAPGTDARGT